MKFLTLCNNIIEYSFYLLLFTVPLVFTNSTSELFEFNKMWVTFGLTILIGMSWITKMILQKQVRIQKTLLDIPLIIFLIAHILSTLFSLDPRTSVWGYYSRFNGGLLSILSYLLLYYAFVSNARDFTVVQVLLKNKPILQAPFFRYSRFVRITSMIAAILIFPLGLFTAQKIVPESTSGHPVMFLFCIATSFILFLYALPRNFLQRIIFMSFFSALIVSLWGIPAHFGYDPSCFLFRGTFDVSCWTDAFHPTNRIFSTLGQPAWLAAYAAIFLPIAIGYFLKEKEIHDRRNESVTETVLRLTPFLVLSILLYLAMLYANTRAGFLAFWIANSVFWGVIIFKELVKQPTKRLMLIILFVLDMLFSAVTVALSHYVLFWFVGVIGYLLLLAILSKKSRMVVILVNGIFLLFTFINPIPFAELNTYFNLPTISQKLSTHVLPAPKMAAKPEQAAGTALETGGSESGEIRKIVWRGALEAWKASPLFGTGVETFAYAYYQYRPAAHNMTSEWDYLYNKAHNEYLNYLTTTGILGFGSYIAIIFIFLFSILKYQTISLFQTQADAELQENTDEVRWARLLSAGLLCGYIAILITNFFGFSVVIVNIYFFLIPALFFLSTGKLSEEKQYLFPKSVTSPVLGGGRYTAITAIWLLSAWFLLLLIRFWNADVAYAMGHNLAGVGQYEQAYGYLQEAYTLRSAEPVIADDLAITSAALSYGWYSQKDTEKAKQFASQAISLSDNVIQAHPNNIIYWKDRVRIFFTLAQQDPQYTLRALQAIQQAAILGPTDAKVHYNLGIIYGQTGNIGQGIKTLEETTLLKPDYRDAYYALAVLYRQQATENGEVVKHPESQKKAEENLQFILTKLSPQDSAAKQLLSTWKK